MAVNGILVSELAKRTGTTRKALRLYEAGDDVAPTYETGERSRRAQATSAAASTSR